MGKYLFHPILKNIFPNWKFFERTSPHYRVFYQINDSLNDKNPWIELDTTFQRKDLRLLFNEKINLQHALNSTIERWILKINQENFHQDSAENLIEFKILKGFIANKIFSDDANFNFKIELNTDVIFSSTWERFSQ